MSESGTYCTLDFETLPPQPSDALQVPALLQQLAYGKGEGMLQLLRANTYVTYP